MKLAKTLVTFGALVSLVACGGQSASAVSQEKFVEEVNKAPEHQYAKIHVTYESSEKYTFVGFSAEEEEMYRTYGGMVDDTVSGSADFQWSGEDWTTNSVVTSEIAMYAGMNAKDLDFSEIGEGVKFFINPFKITMDTSVDREGTKGTTSAVMSFDKYGYLTLATSDVNITATVSEGKTITMKMSSDISLKYSD